MLVTPLQLWSLDTSFTVPDVQDVAKYVLSIFTDKLTADATTDATTNATSSASSSELLNFFICLWPACCNRCRE